MDISYLHRNAHDVLRKAKRVLVVSHPKPDGDTLGASAAMFNYLRTRGVQVGGFCKDRIPPHYAYIPGTEEYTTDYAVFADPSIDVIAVFDAGDLRFAGIADALAARTAPVTLINFDHHATNQLFGRINVLDIASSSTAQVVYDFLKVAQADITPAIATCLLTGILYDTGNFSNAATTWTSLGVASELVRLGGKIHDVSNRLTRNKSPHSLRLWGTALSRLKHHPETGITSTAIFADEIPQGNSDEDHTEGISNFLNKFLDTSVVLVLKELPEGKVKGSFRTVHDIDVSAPAQMLGGGGHKKAAGFTVAGRIVETSTAWQVVRDSEATA